MVTIRRLDDLRRDQSRLLLSKGRAQRARNVSVQFPLGDSLHRLLTTLPMGRGLYELLRSVHRRGVGSHSVVATALARRGQRRLLLSLLGLLTIRKASLARAGKGVALASGLLMVLVGGLLQELVLRVASHEGRLSNGLLSLSPHSRHGDANDSLVHLHANQ